MLMLRRLEGSDRSTLRRLIVERWGAETVVVQGAGYRPHELPGFIAEAQGAIVGCLTFQIGAGGCNVVTIDGLDPHDGIGSRQLAGVALTPRAASGVHPAVAPHDE